MALAAAEDYEVGHRRIPLYTLKENGKFDDESGIFSGISCKKS